MNLEQAQEDLYRRVASWLDQAFVKLARPLEGENAFMLELKQAHTPDHR
jgi:hypothetical protein